ncbi:MAG: response regulator, partial [Desulfuromonadales bacterium]|nr:response regulator [Desulfuromonadales bacterium]NIR34440.1 response regulator [Desulfuromonadales bacterium]NIS42977.1 response regulator [Desulfuromonadales bacterium]
MTGREDNPEQPVALVVDDDQLVRTLVRDSLEKFGFRVLEAENGLSALEVFLDNDPQLILLDLLMPGLDGFETCRELRSLPRGKYVPILVLTALEDEESINKAYDAGGTDFITKPINMTALGHHARYLLRSSRTFNHLQVNEARLSTAQRIARLGDWEWTLKTDTVVCSRELARLLGLKNPPAELDRSGFLQFIDPAQRDRVGADLEQVAQTGQEYDRDLIVVRADGQRRFMHTHAEVTRDEVGRAVKVIGIFHDITERKLLEQDLDRERNFVSTILDTAG